jgi:hypothetical protein
MSVQYQAIGWNRQKRIYDLVLVSGVVFYLAIFRELAHCSTLLQRPRRSSFEPLALLRLYCLR